MAKEILQNGGEILCDIEVNGIITQDKRAIGIRTNGGDIYGDIVISTAPFRDMVLSLDELDSAIKDLAQNLKFRNTILVYVEVDCATNVEFSADTTQKIFDDNWIYVHSKNIETGRITNFANWTQDLRCGRSESILCLEYWANDDEKLWNLSSDEVINIAKKDLLDSNLVAHSSQIKRTHALKIHKSYPIYEAGL